MLALRRIGHLRTICRNCGGEGRVPRVETLDVRIPPGAQTGSRVRVAGRGNAGMNGGPPGDLYIIMKVAAAPIFRPARRRSLYGRSGDRDRSLAGRESRGANDRWPVAGAHSAGHEQREKLRLREKGAPSSRQPGKRGDQIIEVQVVVPKPEDERVRNLLKELDQD